MVLRADQERRRTSDAQAAVTTEELGTLQKRVDTLRQEKNKLLQVRGVHLEPVEVWQEKSANSPEQDIKLLRLKVLPLEREIKLARPWAERQSAHSRASENKVNHSSN